LEPATAREKGREAQDCLIR
jgi:hypothetical protein